MVHRALRVPRHQPLDDGGESRLSPLTRALLWTSLGFLVLASAIGLFPVSNPGVQQCGSPVVFAAVNTDNVRIPSPGATDEPENAAKLRTQSRCSVRVDSQLMFAGLALVIGVLLGFVGAIFGLVQDGRSYRRAPRFESYLRERPATVPDDPWDQPVVPVEDLGERVPEVEWSEVRTLVGFDLFAVVGLSVLGPWSSVQRALGSFNPGWFALALALIAATYVIGGAQVLIAAGRSPRPSTLRFGDVVTVGIAGSYCGRLLPEFGTAGLAVHELVRIGIERVVAVRRIAVLQTGAVLSHLGLLCAFGFLALMIAHPSGSALMLSWLVVIGVVAMLVAGLATATRRYHNMVVRPDVESMGELAALTQQLSQLGLIVGTCIARALFDAFVLIAVMHTFGGSASLVAVIAVSLGASVARVVAFSPDGAGACEAVLALGLIWAGVDAGTAVATTIAYRIVTCWLPMLPGHVAMGRLDADGVI